MIEKAIAIVRQAELFVIVGTSLVVYPAAGLVSYAGRNVPKFIIDKKVPVTGSISDLTIIEKPATEME